MRTTPQENTALVRSFCSDGDGGDTAGVWAFRTDHAIGFVTDPDGLDVGAQGPAETPTRRYPHESTLHDEMDSAATDPNEERGWRVT